MASGAMKLRFATGGCNRTPNCSDALEQPDIFAFASNNVVLLYQLDHSEGTCSFWCARTFTGSSISCIKLHKLAIESDSGDRSRSGDQGLVYLYCGFHDGQIAVHSLGSYSRFQGRWQMDTRSYDATMHKYHSSTVNCIDVRQRQSFTTDQDPHVSSQTANRTHVMAAASSDGSVSIWKVLIFRALPSIRLIQHIKTRPMLPLSVKLFNARFSEEREVDSVPKDASSTPHTNTELASKLGFLVGGTSKNLLVFTQENSDDDAAPYEPTCSIKGHDDWIRSIDTLETDQETLIVTASHDKTIRLWTFKQGRNEDMLSVDDLVDPEIAEEGNLPSRRFQVKSKLYARPMYVSFDALLLGHDDWVYTVKWNPERREILSISADTAAMIWKEDNSGVWTVSARFGEISAAKGATTATGNSGGFFGGLWVSQNTFACHSRSGGWSFWRDSGQGWAQNQGATGHTDSITDLDWEPQGRYLVTSSSDQTARIWAPYQATRHGIEDTLFFAEVSRPQIHGYDLNAITFINQWTIASAGDEKVLRIFKCPQDVYERFKAMGLIREEVKADLPQSAQVPLLGLSNKASDNDTSDISAPGSKFEGFPIEEVLSRRTLWPEIEKLYGHGYELNAVAASHAGDIVVSACKSSNAEHAVLRLYDTSTWTEIGNPIMAHSLTVTRIQFSPDDRFLLSVGRDRQWAVYRRSGDDHKRWTPAAVKVGHSRMILDACWLQLQPQGGPATLGFATASRDKKVKFSFWDETSQAFTTNEHITQVLDNPVTCVDFYPMDGIGVMAFGLASGHVKCFKIRFADGTADVLIEANGLVAEESSTTPVHRVKWCPDRNLPYPTLACASDDGVLRFYAYDQ